MQAHSIADALALHWIIHEAYRLGKAAEALETSTLAKSAQATFSCLRSALEDLHYNTGGEIADLMVESAAQGRTVSCHLNLDLRGTIQEALIRAGWPEEEAKIERLLDVRPCRKA